MKKLFSYCILFSITIIFTSCASKKNVLLMQNLDTNSSLDLSHSYASVLQPGDILTITVSSSDNIGVAPFNVFINDNALGTDNSVTRQRLANYVVDERGKVQFPVLGELEVSGKTVLDTRKYIEQRLKQYLKEPIVIIEWLNFKYTVLGSVNRPGQFQSTSERVSILDALGNAGDLDIYASRKNVLLIREINGVQNYYTIDLTKKDFLASEAFYLKQNDVIMVSPNGAQIQSSAYNRNTPIFVSIASLLVSVTVLLTR